MVYGAIAAIGLTVITDLLVDNAFWLRLIGGCFLLYLGIKTFLEKPANHAAQANQSGYFGAYISTFFLTITNPMTITHSEEFLRGQCSSEEQAHPSCWSQASSQGQRPGGWLSASGSV